MDLNFPMIAIGAIIICVPLVLVYLFHANMNQWVTVVLFNATTQLMITAKDTEDADYHQAWLSIKEAFDAYPDHHTEIEMGELFAQIRKTLDLKVRTDQQQGSPNVLISKRALGLFDHWHFLQLRELQRIDKGDIKVRLKVIYIIRMLSKI